ncbi:MAG TPA: GNAT family N-acetyltransferase [Candidatus Limiplasma sp.]|nr:GNAT family N-acetyltransferase [Candidatus Limiplasma sp.]
MAVQHRFKTKRLELQLMTDEQMEALINEEPDETMKLAYGEMLEGSRKHPEARQWYAAWDIRLRHGERVGDLCYKGVPINGEVEIGYGLLEACRGKGYATEAAGASIDWAFAQPGVYAVTAETEPNNQQSMRVLQKFGFVRQGEGVEGPRFIKEKPVFSWLSIYLLLGVAVGLSFGASTGNMTLSLPIGIGAGLAVGAGLDWQDRVQRQKCREAKATPSQAQSSQPNGPEANPSDPAGKH